MFNKIKISFKTKCRFLSCANLRDDVIFGLHAQSFRRHFEYLIAPDAFLHTNYFRRQMGGVILLPWKQLVN